jgi:polyvinyl alcohol dehydrogenase (cytochrome)
VSFGSATTVIPGVLFQGGSDGSLLALSTTDGSKLWQFETNRTFDAVNKTPTKGGSISAPGPTVAGGMVLVGSGYAVLGGTPGNALLAFGPP